MRPSWIINGGGNTAWSNVEQINAKYNFCMNRTQQWRLPFLCPKRNQPLVFVCRLSCSVFCFLRHILPGWTQSPGPGHDPRSPCGVHRGGSRYSRRHAGIRRQPLTIARRSRDHVPAEPDVRPQQDSWGQDVSGRLLTLSLQTEPACLLWIYPFPLRL